MRVIQSGLIFTDVLQQRASSLFQWLTQPVTSGWVWDYQCFICAVEDRLRLLRLSYVKMRDCQEKPQGCDNNLSISPFFLLLPLSFYFNLSRPCLLSSSLTFHPLFLSPNVKRLCSFPFLPPYLPLPRLLCLSPLHHIYISFFSSSA